ncbi:MAG: glycosyltransferase [Candidatus Micrarchaeia archaeon]
MRIAFYSDTYLPAVDGVVTSMLQFKKELEKRGHKVFIFAPSTIQNKKKYEAKDVFLYTGLKFRPYPQYSSAIFPYHSIIKLSQLKIDLVHVQTPFVMGFSGLLAAKLGRYPLVGSFHTLINDSSLAEYYPSNMRGFYMKYAWKYVKFFYKRCNTVIVPSKPIASLLKKHGVQTDIAVVPNGLDTGVFNSHASPDPAIESYDLDPHKKIVLYIGRISKEKRIEVFLKAAAYLARKRSDLQFVVGGTGPMLSTYVRMAKRLGVLSSVKFIGFVNKDLLPSVYAAADAFCLPSLFETQGIVCLEAMGVGKPVIVADTPVLNEFVKPGYNGERFKKNDSLDCARKIEKVLNKSEAYKKGAIRTARMFSIEQVTDELINVYKNTLDKAVY